MPEIGGTGTDVLGGFITSDYNTDLIFPASIEIFNEMRKSDATVAAGISSCKNPILSANYDVIRGSEDERDIDIALFVRRVFGIDAEAFSPHMSWRGFLQHLLLMYDWGFMYHEKVFGVFEDKIIYKKLAPRLPISITGFMTNDGRPGIEQIATKNPFTKNEQHNNYSIPWEKLFHIAYQQEGDNLVGVSLLRPAYKHWYMKNNFYKIQAVGMERHANGIPTAQRTEQGKRSPEEKTQTENTLRNIRSNSQGYIDSPWGTEFKFTTVDGSLPDINKPIEHHDQEIAIALQSKFLSTGRSFGSFGQSKNETDFLFNALKGNIDFILERINRHLVKQIVDLNFDNIENYPKIIVSKIGEVDLNEFSLAIERLSKSGMRFTDQETQNIIRKTLNLPVIEDEDFEEQEGEGGEEEGIEDGTSHIDEEEEIEEKMKKSLKSDLTIKQKERAFVDSITNNEIKITNQFNKVNADFEKTEDKLKKFIRNQYKKAKTTKMAGSTVLQQSGNFQIMLDIKNKAIEEYKKLGQKYNKDHADKITNQAYARGLKTTQKLKGNTAWSQRGYIFNMGKVIIEAPINISEKVNDHFGTFAVAAIALSQVDDIVDSAVNKNRFRLSYETYPRSAYKQAIFEENPDIEEWKMVVPEGVIDRFSVERPEGFTMKNVFMIGSISFWASRRDDENANPLIFPIHQNSKDYYVPISEEDSEEQHALSKEQRKKVNSLSIQYDKIGMSKNNKDKKAMCSEILVLHNLHKTGKREPTPDAQKKAIYEYVNFIIDKK